MSVFVNMPIMCVCAFEQKQVGYFPRSRKAVNESKGIAGYPNTDIQLKGPVCCPSLLWASIIFPFVLLVYTQSLVQMKCFDIFMAN